MIAMSTAMIAVFHRLELHGAERAEGADRRRDDTDGASEDVPAEHREPRQQQRGPTMI
jgi:hypothetical protein